MRVTAGGALIKDGKILLGLRSAGRAYYPDTWDVFGGHVEDGESPEEALIREIEEELGIVPTAYECLSILDEPNPEKYGPGRHHIYAIRQWTGIPANVSDEHQDLRWFDVSRLGTLNLAFDRYPELFARIT